MEGTLVILHQHPLSTQTVQFTLLLLQPQHRILVKVHVLPAQLPRHHQAALVQRRVEAGRLAHLAVAALVLVELEDHVLLLHAECLHRAICTVQSLSSAQKNYCWLSYTSASSIQESRGASSRRISSPRPQILIFLLETIPSSSLSSSQNRYSKAHRFDYKQIFDELGSVMRMGLLSFDGAFAFLAFSYRYSPMVFSPRFLLAGGLPVDGLHSILSSCFCFQRLSFLVKRFTLSCYNLSKKSLLTIILDILLMLGWCYLSAYLIFSCDYCFFLASLSLQSSCSCMNLVVESLLVFAGCLAMILGLKVHSFISYCSRLRRYSLILSICLSLPLLLMMLDSSSSLNLLAMMLESGLMLGLNLQFSTSFSLLSSCMYSLCLRASSFSLVFFSQTKRQLLMELSFNDLLLTPELLRLLLLSFLLELLAYVFFLESWYNRQKTLYLLLVAPTVVPLLLLDIIIPESLWLDCPVLFLLLLTFVFSSVFSMVFFSLD